MERTQFEEAKEDLAKMLIKQVIEKLQVNLRPLALRETWAPDAMDFYLKNHRGVSECKGLWLCQT